MLAFDTGSLVLVPPPSVEEMKEPLRKLQTRVVQLSQDVRQIALQLHPRILEDLGITAALTELCDEFSAREGIEVAFEQEACQKLCQYILHPACTALPYTMSRNTLGRVRSGCG